MDSKATQSDIDLLPWIPGELLLPVKPNQIRFANGFLKCQPQGFFPGLALHWDPIFHSFNIQVEVKGITPSLTFSLPARMQGYAARLGEERIGVFIEQDLASRLVDAIVPDAENGSEGVVIEYLARRLFRSLSDSWSGQRRELPRFEGPISIREIDGVAAVDVTLSVNKVPGKFTVILGSEMAIVLDKLWRKLSSVNTRFIEIPDGEISIEIAQLAIPPALLSDYVRPGAIIDLAVGITDTVLLRCSGMPWCRARLMKDGQFFAVEIGETSMANPQLPEGASRVCFEIGQFRIALDQIENGLQQGTILSTGIRASDRSSIMVSGQQVGNGLLKIYGNRLAMVVEG